MPTFGPAQVVSGRFNKASGSMIFEQPLFSGKNTGPVLQDITQGCATSFSVIKERHVNNTILIFATTPRDSKLGE